MVIWTIADTTEWSIGSKQAGYQFDKGECSLTFSTVPFDPLH